MDLELVHCTHPVSGAHNQVEISRLMMSTICMHFLSFGNGVFFCGECYNTFAENVWWTVGQLDQKIYQSGPCDSGPFDQTSSIDACHGQCALLCPLRDSSIICQTSFKLNRMIQGNKAASPTNLRWYHMVKEIKSTQNPIVLSCEFAWVSHAS